MCGLIQCAVIVLRWFFIEVDFYCGKLRFCIFVELCHNEIGTDKSQKKGEEKLDNDSMVE